MRISDVSEFVVVDGAEKRVCHARDCGGKPGLSRDVKVSCGRCAMVEEGRWTGLIGVDWAVE